MPGHYVGKGDPIVDVQVDDIFRLTELTGVESRLGSCSSHIEAPIHQATPVGLVSA